MRVDIQMKPNRVTQRVAQRLTEKLRLALGSFASGIADVQFLLDAKPQDQKAGRWAMIKVNFYTGGRLILETRGDTVGQAAARGLSRVRSAVEREMIRRWEWVDNNLPAHQGVRLSGALR